MDKKKILEKEDISAGLKLYVTSVIVMFAALIMAFIEILLTYDVLWHKLAVAGVILVFILVNGISIKLKKPGLGATVTSILIVLLYIPFTYFTAGGMSGDAPIWFIFGVLFLSISHRGVLRALFLSLELAVVSACYFLSFIHPEYIIMRDTPVLYLYSYVAVLIVGLATYIIVKFMIDIYLGEKVKSEEQMEEIRVLSDSQNQFFSSMSHEIRTPINTIIGLNEMILREDISEEVAEDAANIYSAGKMLLSLINDILDMSKLESGQMQITPVAYHPGNMLSDIVGMLWVRAKEKNLEFHINVAPDIPDELLGDEVRIKQVLINVLNNAIKYTKEGSVTLSVQCEMQDDDTANIIYSVADTGIGIKKDDIPYLFTAFKRVDESENRHIEGTGLGLSIVKRFVDLMNGKVTVNSVYTVGTTFVVEIPQKIIDQKPIGNIDLEKLSVSERIKKHRLIFEAPKARILVVDDNIPNLMVVTKLLRDTKITVDTVTSGAAALEKTLNNSYDAIFMDHMMPEMDGIECHKQIRTQAGGRCKEVKVVIFTANAGEENRALYEKEGFDGYLVKPVSGEELENELYRILPANLVKVTGDTDEVYEKTISWMNDNQKKKQVKITTESVADLPKNLVEKYEISVIPHMVSTDNGIFKDGLEIDTRGVLSYMENRNNHLETKAPGTKEHEEFFAKNLTKANNIIHISISSLVAQSGCPSAMEASGAFDNVTVFDTGHLSSGQGLMAIEASRLAEKGKSVEEIIKELEDTKSRVHTSFVVDDLEYLARTKQLNYRIANFVKSISGRPVLVLKNGKMGVGRIFFGSREKAWKRYINICLSPAKLAKMDKRILFVTYVGLNEKERDWIRARIEAKAKFDEIYFQVASPAIAVNCGPGTFGLLFMDKKDRIW